MTERSPNRGRYPKTAAAPPEPPAGSDDEISLLDILDHVLNAGVVLQGSIVISLAGVDLVYVGLNVVLTSVETALRHLENEDQRNRRLDSPDRS